MKLLADTSALLALVLRDDRHHPDAAAFVRAGIDNRAVSTTVEVLVHAPAEAVRAKVGQWSTIEDAGEGRCRLRMTVDSLDWVLMALGVVGADFEVVRPPELTERVREWSARFGRSVGDRTSPTTPAGRTAPTTGPTGATG